MEKKGSPSQRGIEGRKEGSLSQCGRTWDHISGVKRRRELISVWEVVGAYLMGEEKEGTYLTVGRRLRISGVVTCRGSILQGRIGGGVYCRGG